MKVTIERCREWLAKCDKNGKKPEAYDAVKELLAGLVDAARVIRYYEMECVAYERTFEHWKKQLEITPGELSSKLILQDLLADVLRESRQHEQDRAVEAFKKRNGSASSNCAEAASEVED